MRQKSSRPAHLLASVALVALSGLAVAGCATAGRDDITGSVAATQPGQYSDAQWQRAVHEWGARYRAKPRDARTAMAYAQALRAVDRREQAAAVLEQASLHNPKDMALLGAYGRALADSGQYERALQILSRAHTPDRPDWRILSVQGTVLDQLGRHADAQRYYDAALKIVPDEPSVLSNLGLSYALAKDLKRAEATLRRAAAQQGAGPRVRQNLALVVGLQGRFAEAETIARADLPPDEAAANVAVLRQMLASKGKALNPAEPQARSRG